jgi:hypothetical protein
MGRDKRVLFNPAILREHIRSTLKLVGLSCRPEAEELLLGTCAQESLFGTHRRQLGGGPALGIYQVEPATEQSLWKDHILYRPLLASAIIQVCGVSGPNPIQLENNLSYQHIICRLRYYAWVKDPIPTKIPEQALYWKEHYNTPLGAGTPEEYIENYKKFVLA